MSTEPEEIQGPAIIRDHHRQDREVSKVAGAPRAWRSASPLEAAFDMGKLDGGANRKWSAIDRFEAGKRYASLCAQTEPQGRDSTMGLHVSRSTGSGAAEQTRHDAGKAVASLNAYVGPHNRIILRMVCCEGYLPSEAVKLACGDYKHTVAARFRESLDALCEAFQARKAMTNGDIGRAA